MRIASIRHAVPARVVSNDDILAAFRARNAHRLDADALRRLTRGMEAALEAAGTEVRHLLGEGERAFDLVVEAGRRALAEAGLAPEDVDLLVYTGVGRGWLEPATAGIVQTALGLHNATGFDVLDACASWLRGVHVAQGFMRAGIYRRVMVVNCECASFSSYADWDLHDVAALEHRVAAFTIGEAATATLLTDERPDDNFYCTFRTFGEYLDLCMIPLPNVAQFLPAPPDERFTPGKFLARSRPLLETASAKLNELFHADPRLHGQRYDVAFFHEATARVSRSVARALGVEDAHFPTHRRFGNTVSASVPLGMSVAIDEGRLRRGHRVLVVIGSAGLTVGFATLTF